MASAELTIDHEDIPGYMSAMEMTLPVSETGLIGATKTGDKVEFEMLRDGSILTITKLSKIGEVAIVNGAAIYAANCAACHGAAGEGAKRGIPLTKGHAIDHPEVEHIKQVTDGEKGKMPAFHDKLTPDEIAAVVKHVRDVIQKDVKPEMRGHHH